MPHCLISSPLLRPRIERILWERRLSYAALGEACGVSRQRAHQWVACPTWQAVERIAGALGLPVESLATQEQGKTRWLS